MKNEYKIQTIYKKASEQRTNYHNIINQKRKELKEYYQVPFSFNIRAGEDIIFLPYIDFKTIKPMPISEFNEYLLNDIIEIYNKIKSFLGYVSFWDLYKELFKKWKMNLKEIIILIESLRKENPYMIRYSVNRLGHPVYFKIM